MQRFVEHYFIVKVCHKSLVVLQPIARWRRERRVQGSYLIIGVVKTPVGYDCCEPFRKGSFPYSVEGRLAVLRRMLADDLLEFLVVLLGDVILGVTFLEDVVDVRPLFNEFFVLIVCVCALRVR